MGIPGHVTPDLIKQCPTNVALLGGVWSTSIVKFGKFRFLYICRETIDCGRQF